MHRFRLLTDQSALVAAGVGVVAGSLTGNFDLAVFGGLVGFFLGKSIRSTVRTFSIDEGQ